MSDRLNPGDRLFPGDALSSPNGRLVLRMQDDGNLVLYASGDNPIWATGTNGRPDSILAMQEDGNLVVIAPGNVPVWSSGTFGQSDCVLIIQDYGNLVIYAVAGNRAVWSTDTRDPVEVITELFMAMTDTEFRNVCNECGIQVGAAGVFGGPGDAAEVVVGSPDCRNCVKESFRRTVDTIREIAHEREKREAKERFDRMDRQNSELERYDRYRNTA